MNANLQEKLIEELMDEVATDKLVLPSLPEIALKVRDAVEDPDMTSAKLAKVITMDAGLTARLIQVANSPLVRGNREIDSVEAAVVRMGNTMVKSIVNSLIVQQMFQPTTELSDKKFRLFWQHSSQVAAICHALAGFAKLKPDQALLAGLVHDIGALPIIKRAEDVPELLASEEMLDNIIRCTHAEIGKAMLNKWEFPQSLVEAAAEHENLSRQHDGPPDYADLVTVANLQSYVGEDHYLAAVEWSEVPAFAKLGLDTDVSIVDMEEKGDEIREVQSALLG
ncbi:MAG: HDOD domain-containing protein [Gammaproteobacteria bacterium]|jgi:putative nucleotidyltransferase with HDIG domain